MKTSRDFKNEAVSSCTRFKSWNPLLSCEIFWSALSTHAFQGFHGLNLNKWPLMARPSLTRNVADRYEAADTRLERAQNCLLNNFQNCLCCLLSTILMHPQDMLYQVSIEKRLFIISDYRQIILIFYGAFFFKRNNLRLIIEIFLQLKPYNI